MPENVESVGSGPELFRIGEAADALGMATRHLHRCCSDGRVEGTAVNGHVYIACIEIDRIQDEQRRARTAAVIAASSASERLRLRLTSRVNALDG